MKTDRIIALDIGADGIRMAVAASGTSNVLDAAYEPYASDAPAGLPREAVVAMTLKRLLDGRKPGTNRACISVEGQSVFARLVKLPMVEKDQVDKTIRHEAVQNIPFPIDEVIWDAHVIDSESPEPEVLLVAVKADLVEGLAHAVSANGLLVERISVAPVALANALRASGEKGPVLLVDPGAAVSNLVFVDGARIFFRTLPVGEDDTKRLEQEVERSITFYRTQQGGRTPERILMCGDAGLKDRLSMPVHVVSLSVCSGLAAMPFFSIDLVPATLLKERDLKRRLPLWLASAFLLILLTAVWIVNLNLQSKRTVEQTAMLKQEIASLSGIEQKMLPLEGHIEELNARTAIYASALERRALWVEVLNEVGRLLPDGMFLVASEPIRQADRVSGSRITVVSYLDKEPEGQDAVKLLRDALRSSELFSGQTKVFSRPSKKLFAREFVLDVYFAEDES